MSFRIVLLPDPFCPMMVTLEPSSTEKLALSRMGCSCLYSKLTSRKDRTLPPYPLLDWLPTALLLQRERELRTERDIMISAQTIERKERKE
jgi:hypothetical protein